MYFHELKTLRATSYYSSTHFPMMITSDLHIPYKMLIPAPTALLPVASMPCKYFCLWKKAPVMWASVLVVLV